MIFYRACALDLSKFCRDVPHGGGQQLKCLSNVIRDSKLGLEPKCDSLLRTRLEMFDYALKVVPINGVQDIWLHVSIIWCYDLRAFSWFFQKTQFFANFTIFFLVFANFFLCQPKFYHASPKLLYSNFLAIG